MRPSIVPPLAPSALSILIAQSDVKSASETLAVSILHNLQYQHNWTDLRLHLVCLGGSNAISASNPESESGLIDLYTLNFNGYASLSRHPPLFSGSSTSTNGPSLPSSTPSTPSSDTLTVPLISGLPPHHSYIHPDLQTYLLKHGIKDTDLPIQREYVLPLALGERWSLARFCGVFETLPTRELVTVQAASATTRGGTTDANGDGSARAPRSVPNVTANTDGNQSGQAYVHKDQKRVLLGMRAREGAGGDGTVVYYLMQEGEVKPRQNG